MNCACGCGETPKAGKRFLHGHNRRVPIKERFWRQAQEGSPDQCWPWLGHVGANGYGTLSIGRTSRGAHRIAYELLVGPIPDGLTIDHLCRNRSCVNPAHLEAVTMRTNVLRGATVTAANVRKTHCPKGHPYSEDNTITRPGRSGRECRICNRDASREYQRRKTR